VRSEQPHLPHPAAQPLNLDATRTEPPRQHQPLDGQDLLVEKPANGGGQIGTASETLKSMGSPFGT